MVQRRVRKTSIVLMHGSDKIQAEGIALDHRIGQMDSHNQMVSKVREETQHRPG